MSKDTVTRPVERISYYATGVEQDGRREYELRINAPYGPLVGRVAKSREKGKTTFAFTPAKKNPLGEKLTALTTATMKGLKSTLMTYVPDGMEVELPKVQVAAARRAKKKAIVANVKRARKITK